MSEETKKDEQNELSLEDLDNVAGGKNYQESRSNTAQYTVVPTPPVKPGGTTPGGN